MPDTSKYSRATLRRMAHQHLTAFQQDDPRAFILIMEVSMRTGLTPNQTIQKIKELAA